MASFVRVCSKGDFVHNRYLATVNGKQVAIFQIDGEYYGISNVCAHIGGPIIDGDLDKHGHVVCPWHGYRYDPKTGKAPGGSPERVETFDVKVDGEDVLVSAEPTSKGQLEKEELEFTPHEPQPQNDEKFVWKCLICMDEYVGRMPPTNCAKCRAPHELIQPKDAVLRTLREGSQPKATYPIEEEFTTKYLANGILKDELASRRVEIWRSIAEQEPIDLLIISASAHPQHIVSGYIAPKILGHLKETHPNLVYEWIDLSKYKIEHNWACYSLADTLCRFPCNNLNDDMRKLYPKLVRARSLIIVTPINWVGMNSRLKVFLDRMTNMQDIGLVMEHVDWAGRPVGIFVNGHEDGAYKVAWDVFVVLQNLGYVLPPFGIWYNLSSLAENTNADLQKLRDNSLALSRLYKVAENVIHFMQLRVDKQLAPQPEGEKLRRVHYVAM
jgi:nitrite reductase/ring-hydroxylating ferredoxin subunit/multimeric flavodoxin WrbA